MSISEQFKRRAGSALGWAVCTIPVFAPLRRRLFALWPSRTSGACSRFIYSCTLNYWFSERFLAEPDPDRRESMKAALMGGKSGAHWAEDYFNEKIDFDRRVGSMSFREACPFLESADAALKEAAAGSLVIQIGCSSGKEIAWLCRRNPSHRYIGTDIYSDVVEFCERQYKLPNLSFQTAAAHDVLGVVKREAKGAPVFVISSGSLQYAQPEHLAVFFRELSRLSDVQLILLEPSMKDTTVSKAILKSHWRGNFSFAHQYEPYARDAGLEIIECREIWPFVPSDSFPEHSNYGHYFLRARTRCHE